MIDKFSDDLLGLMLPLSVWEHNYKLAYDIKTTLSCCGLFLLGNIVAFDIDGTLKFWVQNLINSTKSSLMILRVSILHI